MQRTVAQAFNEWMRRYIETPEQPEDVSDRRSPQEETKEEIQW